jgi:hypothetical protein
MPNTFELIASSTVGSGGASSIDFTSIPSTYTDLCLKYSIRAASGAVGYVKLTLNGSTSSFTTRSIESDGSTAYSFSDTNIAGTFAASTYTANTFSNNDLYIPNYAGSTNKSYSTDSVTENNATQAFATLTAGLWSNTAAINAITLTLSSAANLAQYSTAYLYGVKNA